MLIYIILIVVIIMGLIIIAGAIVEGEFLSAIFGIALIVLGFVAAGHNWENRQKIDVYRKAILRHQIGAWVTDIDGTSMFQILKVPKSKTNITIDWNDPTQWLKNK